MGFLVPQENANDPLVTPAQLPTGNEQSFVWPQGALPPKDEGGPAPLPATPEGIPGPQPTQVPEATPGTTPEAQPGAVEATPQAQQVQDILKQLDAADASDLEKQLALSDKDEKVRGIQAQLDAADLIDNAHEHTALQNWAAGFTGRLIERSGQAVEYNPVSGPVTKTLGAAAKFAIENAPSDMVAEVTRKKFIEFLDKAPGTHFKDVARALGAVVDPDKGSMAGEIGQQTVDGLLMLAGIAIVAPEVGGAVAAMHLPRAGAFISRLGFAIKKNPVLATLTQAMGAGPGGVLGEHGYIPGLEGPTGAFVGSLLGGVGFDVVGRRLIQGGVMMGEKGLITLASLLQGSKGPLPSAMRTSARRFNSDVFGSPTELPVPSSPIQTNIYDVGRAHNYAKDVVDGEIARLVEQAEAAIRNVKTPPATNARTGVSDPRAFAVSAFKGLQKMEDVAERLKRIAWNQVQQNRPIKMKDYIWPEVKKLQEELSSRQSFFRPDKEIEDILSLGLVRQERDAVTGQFGKGKQATVEEVLSMSRRLYHAMRNEEGAFIAGRIPRQEYVASINRLRSILYEGIERAYPGDETIAIANETSRRMHDLFSRGNIPRILNQNKLGEQKVDPEQTVDFITSKYEGFRDVIQKMRGMAKMPAIPGQPVTPTTKGNTTVFDMKALTKGERGDARQVIKDIENSLRAKFHDEIEAAGMEPRVATKLLKDLDRVIPVQANLYKEVSQAIPRLANSLASQKAIQASTLAKFAKTSAENAVSGIFRDPDPALRAKELMVAFRGNKDALTALQDGIFSELFTRSQGKPLELKALVSDTRVQSLLDTIYGGHGAANRQRFDKVVDIVSRLEAGDFKTAKQYWLPSATLAARFAAAGVGRWVGSLGGGATIQGTGAVANAAKQLTVKLLGQQSPEFLLAKAIRDPNWERFVLSMDPASEGGARRLISTMQRVVRSEEAIRRLADFPKAPEDKKDRPQSIQEVIRDSTPLSPNIEDRRNPISRGTR